MIGKSSSEVPNMSQRALMQYLSLDDWKVASRLPVPAGELMLSRLRDNGWIEIQGESNIWKSDSPWRGTRRCGRLYEAIRKGGKRFVIRYGTILLPQRKQRGETVHANSTASHQRRPGNLSSIREFHF